MPNRVALCLSILILSAVPARADEPVTFEKHVRPLLKAHCFECHGEGAKLKGGLDLRLRRTMVTGGSNGAAVIPGKADDSLVIQLVRSGEMPPGKRKLTARETAILERWIGAGATVARAEPKDLPMGFSPSPDELAHWSFQPIARPAVPKVKARHRVRNPIDAFLLAKLEAKGLSFGPEANRRTLIRRSSFDLLGLPPTPQEVDAFLGDASSIAYERLIDRLLDSLNRSHLQQHPGELDLEARVASFELAARMQTAARSALDLSSETAATRRMYGLDEPASAEYGTRCLIARRLIERGVRFVQVCTRNQFWDHHGHIYTALPSACRMTDRPNAAFIKDLKSRGLLDSTVVHWGGEMGRLPVIQNDTGRDRVGRDHNTHGFTMWLAGGGIKAGHVHGATDDFGHHAVENVVNHYDYHATLLHLFGLDHRRVVYHRNGQEATLTDNQPSRIVTELLA